MKKIFTKLSALFISLFSLAVFSSCDLFQAPMKDYFEEYSTGVGILEVDYGMSLDRDSDGVLCLPSGQNREITFLLRNPKNFPLELKYDDSLPDFTITPSGWEQKSNKSIVSFTLNNTDLIENEGGTDWKGLFWVKKLIIPFDESLPFPIELRINSRPKSPEGAVVLVDSSNDTYVLCFNLSETEICKKVHKDLKRLIVTSSQGNIWDYDLNVDAAGKISLSRTNGLDNFEYSSLASFTTNNSVGAAGLSFIAGTNSIYIKTEEPLVDIANDIHYTIRLIDEKGLDAESSTSVYTQKLKPPLAYSVPQNERETSVKLNTVSEIAAGALANPILSQASDGATYIKLNPTTLSTSDQPVTGTRVEYEIFGSEDGGLTFTRLMGSGNVSSVSEIPIPPFACKVRVVSKKANFVDSDPEFFELKTNCSKVFVSSTGSPNGWGTRESPINKISSIFANNLITNTTFDQNTIVILSDLTDQAITIPDYYCVTIAGQDRSGNAKEWKVSADSLSPDYFASVSGTSTHITLKNIMLSDFSSANGGALQITNARVTLSDSKIQSCNATNGGAAYLSGSAMLVMEGDSCISDNQATGNGNAVYVSPQSHIAITGNSYVNVNNEIYLKSQAYIYADTLCTQPVIAKLMPENYPNDPITSEVKLVEAYSGLSPLTSEFCNTRIHVARNPDPLKSDIEYYVVYSALKRYGVLAQGTVASVNSILPSKVKFTQIYMKGLPMTFVAEDQAGNQITPDHAALNIKVRSDNIGTQGPDKKGYPTISLVEYESRIQNGTLEGDNIFVEMSVTISGITFSERQPLTESLSVNSSATFSLAVDMINDLPDTSNVSFKLDADIVINDNTPLLGPTEDKPFNGTFDGNGKTITFSRTSLEANGNKAGVAGNLGPSGVIKNVIVEGDYNNPYSSSRTNLRIAGIAIKNEGLIINCVNKLDYYINSLSDTAGIVVENKGKVINCVNYGHLINRSTQYWSMPSSYMGGIAAVNYGLIENCANFGTIECQYTATISRVPNGLPGAIVGRQGIEGSNTGIGSHCYWIDNCVKKDCSNEGAAYNSYACKNREFDFLWTYGLDDNNNGAIIKSQKLNQTHVYASGTFADLTSNVVAGTTTNTDEGSFQRLEYNGNVLTVMNYYADDRIENYYPDILKWKIHNGQLTLDK